MRLFKLRVTYKDGEQSNPWTVFAESFSEAAGRVEQICGTDKTLSILTQEVPESEALWWGRNYKAPNGLVAQYEDVAWDQHQKH